MAKEHYYPNPLGTRVSLMQHFARTIGPHAGDLGITPEEVEAQSNDAEVAERVFNYIYQLRTRSKAATKLFRMLLAGKGKTPLVVPEPLTLDLTGLTLLEGIEKRFLAMVARMKRHKNYTPEIAKLLNLDGVDRSGPPDSESAPTLKVRKGSHDVVLIAWRKGRFQGVHVEVDRGDGKGFVLLEVDLAPPCKDKTPWPAQATTWRYRAVYLYQGERFGQWSNVAEIDVRG